MPRSFSNRPRAFLASLLVAGSAAMLASAAPSVSTLDPRAAFDLIDADGDGHLDFAEFRFRLETDGFFMTPSAPIDAEERLASESEALGAMHSEFARYDRNADGMIETRELARVIGCIGRDATSIDRSRLQRAGDATWGTGRINASR